MQRINPLPDRDEGANDTVRRPLQGVPPVGGRPRRDDRAAPADPFDILGGPLGGGSPHGAPGAGDPGPFGRGPGAPLGGGGPRQGGFGQTGLGQGGLGQGGLGQAGLGQTGLGQAGLGPSPLGHGGFEPDAFGRGGLGQGGLGQGGLGQGGFGQGGFGQEAFGRGGFGGAGGSGPLADLAAVLAPEPGARRPDALSPAARRADAFVDAAFDAAALNPLVSVASPLLWLAARLNESAAPADVRTFRDRILDEIRRFEAAAMAKGVPNRAMLVARYALCATIDDIILNTAWAGHAHWATGSLVSLLYGETWGGERFFELLQQLVHAPDENIDVLELQAVCLAIGFVGKYRVMEDGQNLLNRLRAELYRIIRRVRGSYERDLAPAWQGAAVPYRAPPSALRFWVPILCALLMLAGFYLVLRLSLANRVDIAMQRIAALVPAAPIPVAKPDIPPAPRKPAALTQVQRISAVLQREIAEHRVEVVGTPTIVAVRLPTASFASASAALPASDTPLIERIATALNREPGSIRVTGYTDNVPIAATGTFRTNVDLSRARAASVAATLQAFLNDPSRVEVVGRGDADPIASNATAEGRARNRRVEIQIPAEETLIGRGAPASAPAMPPAPATAPAPAPAPAGAAPAGAGRP
ncbi:type IVB secretion system protein IcmH/DotU [Methylobacterium sp. NEAU 140]|uniref:type IVB secretion system protein IcmH/DotU n=1 Tax=Methylobacterium sp. NEAU 140 TaxID=3064945 RepID=UPI00273617EA|nr:type IVB secretion system protein IcmH/DotU [Methylobacterium sp. NEAU 140]MDP4025136.1 type IVB secretion system protein IcmH/DotU [Methylobacterium sp. NEAU 140]